METTETKREIFKPGDIFETHGMCGGHFYEVIKSTEKTVVVRPIRDVAVLRDAQSAHSYETDHMPKHGEYTTVPWWPNDVCKRGKRCNLLNGYSTHGGVRIKITGGVYAAPWDGKPAIVDHYN